MKAVKVAVSAALCDVLAALCDVSATLRDISAALCGMFATPCNMLATKDTPGDLRDPRGGGGVVLYMKNFHGLELLKNHF